MDAEGAVGLEKVPASIAVFFVHAGQYATRDAVASGFDPSAIAEFLVFFEVACCTEIEGATGVHDRSRAEFAIGGPGDLTCGFGCHGAAADAAGGIAGAFVEGDVEVEVFGGDLFVESVRGGGG